MGKLIGEYLGYTASDIKTKADIPDQVDMNVVSTDVDCINISIARVHNGIESSLYNLGGLCESGRVNKWSWFGPTEWNIESEILVNSVKTPYSLGEWAGYNHDATPPSIIAKTTEGVVYSYPADTSITAYVQAGELDYESINGNIHKLWLQVYDGVTPVNSGVTIDIDDVIDGGSHLLINTFTYNYTTDHTYNAKLYYGDSIGQVVAYYPNIGSGYSWEIPYTSWYLNPVSWTFQIRENWPETPYPEDVGDSFVTRLTTEFYMHYDLSRFGDPQFTSNLIIDLYVMLKRKDHNGTYQIIATGPVAGSVTTTGVGDPQRFTKGGYLYDIVADTGTFPTNLEYGDQVSFYMDRISGGFD